MKTCSKSGTIDRKTIEKNRRIHMKALCFKLVSLISPTSAAGTASHKNSSNKDICTQMDQLDHAAYYIQKLKGRIDELQRRKQQLGMASIRNKTSQDTYVLHDIDDHPQDIITSNVIIIASNNLLNLPILEVRDFDTTLEVVLITALNKNVMFYGVITLLEEEGAEVTHATFSVVNDKIFHTIHSQATFGVETSRVCERLKQLIS
ncbi:hypothetical protein C5167_006454 [Papaver somniferum]|uniref:BHLH domain-containing protein n=1 Tax=Papaver somniferum TaxID=3469 RepID=A0A4Y7JHK9_PAPSO|nr:transcription factor bHLH162-like [Papaver somniferum]RZC59145.1 hypothetical protein C5167_006454 [Papaver somniferum]